MMNKNANCECYIGMLLNYDDTDLTTAKELKETIERNLEFASEHDWYSSPGYTMTDYCDRRKSTDLIRFNYCPMCGKKIDWKALKEVSK